MSQEGFGSTNAPQTNPAAANFCHAEAGAACSHEDIGPFQIFFLSKNSKNSWRIHKVELSKSNLKVDLLLDPPRGLGWTSLKRLRAEFTCLQRHKYILEIITTITICLGAFDP